MLPVQIADFAINFVADGMSAVSVWFTDLISAVGFVEWLLCLFVLGTAVFMIILPMRGRGIGRSDKALPSGRIDVVISSGQSDSAQGKLPEGRG